MQDPYLSSSEWIDADHPAVMAKAREVVSAAKDPTDRARIAFELVRDGIRHAGDHQASPTTCRASDVLREEQGWCFAKAHLLVAILRASGIRAGLAYQRLALDEAGSAFTLHGLVAAEIPGVGWYRMDPRGNKPGIDAQFTPPVERLAFAPTLPGERDLPGIHAEPLPEVITCLHSHDTWSGVRANLPDAG